MGPKTPNLPPEVIWFPLWFPFSIYNFAQWARATLMPIALAFGKTPRPAAAVASAASTRCFPGGRDANFDYELPKKADAGGWDRFFRGADKVSARASGFRRAPYRLALWRPAAVASVHRMDRAASRRRRRLGRHSTAVDLFADGAVFRGLCARPSGAGEIARRV